MMNDSEDKRLAKMAEEANFEAKNRYRLQRQTLDFIDKKRQPVEASKVKDLLRNH
jgi:hypothetical protein